MESDARSSGFGAGGRESGFEGGSERFTVLSPVEEGSCESQSEDPDSSEQGEREHLHDADPSNVKY